LSATYSLIIPTHNRRETLLRVLRAVERLGSPELLLEVIVVDDGSADGTAQAATTLQTGHPLQVLRQPQRGPAAARNAGAASARGQYALFLDDDIEPSPDLLQQHHARRGSVRTSDVVVGRVAWPPEVVQTPFLRFVTEHYCFGFEHLDEASELTFRHFVTANLSLPRALLLEHGGFDERFPYCFEDTDLGLRLANAGVRLLYAPEAVGRHLRPTGVDAFCRRQELIGPSALVFARKHPDHPEVTRLDRLPRWGTARGALKKLLFNRGTRPVWKATAALLSRVGLVRAAELLYFQLLSYHYYRGIAHALAPTGALPPTSAAEEQGSPSGAR